MDFGNLPADACKIIWRMVNLSNQSKVQALEWGKSYSALKKTNRRMVEVLPRIPNLYWCFLHANFRLLHVPVVLGYQRMTKQCSLRELFILLEDISIACLQERQILKTDQWGHPWHKKFRMWLCRLV